jgi:hypothetical protein
MLHWLEGVVRNWLNDRQDARVVAYARKHPFLPRAHDPRQCAFVTWDDGLSDQHHCNQPPEWHRA